MEHSSQKLALDNRLLSVEELLRRRSFADARQELNLLDESDFDNSPPDKGLYYSLIADCFIAEGSNRESLEYGLRAARLLADFPYNRRYARAQLVISKAYSALGDMKNAEIRSRDSLAAYRRAGDRSGQVDALNLIARVAYTRCDYTLAAGLLDEAIVLASGDPRQTARLAGNVGSIRVFTGQWQKAESDLKAAADYHRQHDEEMSLAINLLSLAALSIRRREFVFATSQLAESKDLIERLDLKREKVIYLEFTGELALEKGDFARAKHILSEATHLGRLIAPGSDLVSQSERLLSEVELALENIEEAMKCAQKALEVATQIGELKEIGLAMRVIARVFAARSQHTDAAEYAGRAVEQLRQVGDPEALARTLLVQAHILLMTRDENNVDRSRRSLEEAASVFRGLKLDSWLAETEYTLGVLNCRQGNLSCGFKHLSKSEKLFASVGDTGKVRTVKQFLTSLADQAVALSVSQDNEFKIFGNLLSQSEVTDLKTGAMAEVVQVLLKRTDADRAIIFSPEIENMATVTSVAMNKDQLRRFSQSFHQLLGEEISRTKPTLLLDCRRDPYINELFPDRPEVIASVAVVPFKLSDRSTSYICIAKLSPDGTLNPFSQDELNFAVGFSDIIAFKADEHQKMKLLEDNRRLKAQLREEAAFPNIITRSSSLLEVLSQVRQVVDSNISVSIEGETGCGKDLLARAIHYNSIRRDKRFLSVNCAALPETLLESELFGYVRGAFTGADRDKPGLFEEADGGTFFLDEIADMPLSVQAKILRVLEAKEIVRLGESTPRKVDVRIVSATNKDLKEEMAAKNFRQDLYYRLTALTFRLPPLRDRKEDIPLLVGHFLEGTGKTIGPETLRYLVAYDWPGNIRELDNEIKKLVLLSGEGTEILPDALSSRVCQASLLEGNEAAASALEPQDVEFSDTYSLYDYLARFEKHFIVRALKEHRGIKKHAAASLNIPESTLRLKIKQYDISPDFRTLVN